jgi:hypothetical protein
MTCHIITTTPMEGEGDVLSMLCWYECVNIDCYSHTTLLTVGYVPGGAMLNIVASADREEEDDSAAFDSFLFSPMSLLLIGVDVVMFNVTANDEAN